METQIVNLKQSIEKLLDTAKNIFAIEGDADGLWLMIKNVPYCKGRTIRFSDITVKFLNNVPVVLIPTKSKLGSAKEACEDFLQKGEFLKGWRAICPNAITYHGEDILELVHRITELVGNPNLCDRMDCEMRPCSEDDLPTLFDDEKPKTIETT